MSWSLNSNLIWSLRVGESQLLMSAGWLDVCWQRTGVRSCAGNCFREVVLNPQTVWSFSFSRWHKNWSRSLEMQVGASGYCTWELRGRLGINKQHNTYYCGDWKCRKNVFTFREIVHFFPDLYLKMYKGAQTLWPVENLKETFTLKEFNC